MIKVGDIVMDSITGFMGVAVARTEWLNGCVRVSVQPQKLHEGKPVEQYTFDVEQLVLVPDESYRRPTPLAPSGGNRPNVVRAADPKR